MNITENPALFLTPVGSRATAQDEDGAATATADFESFLSLLTAQLRNQDPLQPLDSTDFVAQLASFSTVEQLVGTNTRLDSLQASTATNEIAALGTWIGRDVADRSGTFRATGGPIQFTVPDPALAERITATVYRADGSALARFDLAPDAQGRAVWNGRDGAGNFIAGEDLRIGLEYRQGDTVINERAAAVFRTVTAIRGTSDGVRIELSDGRSIDPGAVSQLRDRSPASLPLDGA